MESLRIEKLILRILVSPFVQIYFEISFSKHKQNLYLQESPKVKVTLIGSIVTFIVLIAKSFQADKTNISKELGALLVKMY